MYFPVQIPEGHFGFGFGGQRLRRYVYKAFSGICQTAVIPCLGPAVGHVRMNQKKPFPGLPPDKGKHYFRGGQQPAVHVSRNGKTAADYPQTAFMGNNGIFFLGYCLANFRLRNERVRG